MLKQFSHLIAVAAFALVSAAFTSNAHAITANFTVRLDNWLNSSHYAHAASEGGIRVSVTFANGQSVWKDGTLDTIDGSHDFSFSVANQNVNNIDYVMVAMGPGDPIEEIEDLLILDQVELFNGSGTRMNSWGSDDDYGWCISWDANDASNSHCNPSSVATARKFVR
jgi:hypothetical protein